MVSLDSIHSKYMYIVHTLYTHVIAYTASLCTLYTHVYLLISHTHTHIRRSRELVSYPLIYVHICHVHITRTGSCHLYFLKLGFILKVFFFLFSSKHKQVS